MAVEHRVPLSVSASAFAASSLFAGHYVLVVAPTVSAFGTQMHSMHSMHRQRVETDAENAETILHFCVTDSVCSGGGSGGGGFVTCLLVLESIEMYGIFFLHLEKRK